MKIRVDILFAIIIPKSLDISRILGFFSYRLCFIFSCCFRFFFSSPKKINKKKGEIKKIQSATLK